MVLTGTKGLRDDGSFFVLIQPVSFFTTGSVLNESVILPCFSVFSATSFFLGEAFLGVVLFLYDFRFLKLYFFFGVLVFALPFPFPLPPFPLVGVSISFQISS